MAINSKTAEQILSGSNVMSFTNMAARAGAFPLDKWSIFGALSAAEAYVRQETIPGYGDATGLPYEGQVITVRENGKQEVYVLDNSQTNGLRKLATGGDASELEAKLSAEVARSVSVDNELSNAISTLTDVTLPLSVGNLQSSLSTTVVKLDTPESGYEATYVVKQGGVQVGANINIPKDKVISSAYMVTVKGDYETGHTKPEYDYLSSFTVTYAEESTTVKKEDTATSATYWSIYNAYTGPEGGDGSYLRITVTNDEAVPIYIAVPELVDTYIGGETTEISVGVVGKKGETRTIYADIQAGSIAESKLCADFTAKVNNVIAAQAADRSAIEILSGDAATEGSVKKALSDAKAYTNEVSAALSTDYSQKVADEATARDTAIEAKGTVLSNYVDAKAASALSDAKAYTDEVSAALSTDYSAKVADEKSERETAVTSLSTELKGDISTTRSDLSGYVDSKVATEKSERESAVSSARTDLSAYAVEKADAAQAAAILSAKTYTDAEIAKLSVADIYETKVDAAAKLQTAKDYTDEVSSALSTDYTGKINTLDLEKVEVGQSKTLKYVEQTDGQVSAEAVEILINQQQVTGLTSALEGISANLTSDADGSVNARIATAKSEAILSAKNYTNEYTNTVSAWLSSDYYTQIQTEKTRAEGAESTLNTKVEGLSGEVSAISANHETRISANERAIELLSSAVHFRGVITKTEIEKAGDEPTEAEIKAALVKKFKPCEKGDIAIYTDAGTEYIYTSDSAEEADGWVKLGDEGTYVTKATYNAKMTALDVSDATLSGMIQTEETRAEGVETTISTDLTSLSTAYVAKVAELDATDSEISGKVDNKVKVGTATYDGTTYSDNLANKTSLSVLKIADEDYYKLVSAGKVNDDVLYIVSSDYVNGHDQRVINVGTAISSTDAVNLSGMNAAIEAAKQEIVANALSGVQLNGVDFTVTNNVAALSIDIISCGGAL